MRNQDLARLFAKGATKGSANHTYIDGNAIYSYGSHFPMAVRTKDGFIINKDRYSVSTSKHQHYVAAAIGENNLPVKEMSTEQLQGLIREEMFSKSKKKLKEVV